jgi:hypothetical protein
MKFGLNAAVSLIGLVTIGMAPQASWGQPRLGAALTVKMQVKSVIGQDANCVVPQGFKMSMKKAFKKPEEKRSRRARTILTKDGPKEHLLRIMQRGRKLAVIETVSSRSTAGTCTYIFKNA